MEKLPAKITPDNLKDAMVEFHYLSDIPQEIIAGQVYQILQDKFKIMPRQLNAWQLGREEPLRIEMSGLHLTDGCVKIQLSEQSILFNIIQGYPGWTEMSGCVFEVMERLLVSGCFKAVVRIGIRYISEYPGMSIFEVLQSAPALALPFGKGHNTTYRTEISYENCSVLLTLADQMEKKEIPASDLTSFSLVDIVVFQPFRDEPVSNLKRLSETTNRLHDIEKKMFFGILNPAFIHSLQPEFS